MIKAKNILAIDRWTKYIWLAYVQNWSKVVMPIGNLYNNWSIFFDLSDILARYHIVKIIIWYPKDEDLQKRVNEFIASLAMITDKMEIEKVDEEYTSVQASAMSWNFERQDKNDTLAAMKILEGYLEDK